MTVTAQTLPSIAWNNQPVITTELLAEVYGTVTDNIKVNFNRNASRFIEGVHYFLLKGADLKEFLQVTKSYLQISNMTRSLYLWTERGAVRHAKILDTEKAWEVQAQLEDCYFANKKKPTATAPTSPVQPPQFITAKMVTHLKCETDKLIRATNITKSRLWLDFNEHFGTDSYLKLPIGRYPDACRYFDIEPIYDPEHTNNFMLVDAVYLGENETVIDKQRLNELEYIAKTVTDENYYRNVPADKTDVKQMLRDLDVGVNQILDGVDILSASEQQVDSALTKIIKGINALMRYQTDAKLMH